MFFDLRKEKKGTHEENKQEKKRNPLSVTKTMSDPVDPKPELDRECLANRCQGPVRNYEQCLERIKSVDPNKEPHCYEWYFEIVTCVDKCTNEKLWPTLK